MIFQERYDRFLGACQDINRYRDRIAKPQPLDRTLPAESLDALAGQTISPAGIGWEEALRVWADVLAPSTISTDHPASFAFVPGAPTRASALFDLIVDQVHHAGRARAEAAHHLIAIDEDRSDHAGSPPATPTEWAKGYTRT